MSSSPGYIVARLVPASPVSGAAFGTYLDGLRLQVFDANTGYALSDYAYSSPAYLFPDPPGYVSLVSTATSASTPITDPGSTLTFDSTDGIPVGSIVSSADGTIPASSNLQVTAITAANPPAPGEVTLNNPLPNYVPLGTVVEFIGPSPSSDPANAPPSSFSLTTTSPATTRDGQPQTAADPPFVLHFADVSRVTVGMAVTGSAFIASGTTVAETDAASNSVTLSQALSGSPASVIFTLNQPYIYFQLLPLAGGTPGALNQLTFEANGTNGIATGMTLAPIPDIIKPGTTVTGVTSTTVTLSQNLQGPWILVLEALEGQAVTFTFPLSSGIAQHVVGSGSQWALAAVATALIPLNPPQSSMQAPTAADCPAGSTLLTFSGPGGTDGIGAGMPVSGIPAIPSGAFVQSMTATTVTLSAAVSADVPSGTQITFTIVHDYYDIEIVATRGADIIPVGNTFYNVPVTPIDAQLPFYMYQSIPESDTSLYITLPPQPGTSLVPLTIPSDGSAPAFDLLLEAMETALANDTIPGATLSSLIASPADCTRVAYDIIWSYQNSLPAPPDLLESLYTIPPATGGGGSTTSNTNGSTNLEQDRQQFEGTLNSFYSTGNANAERLAKFVAAASAAVSCEQASLNSTAALLEFPVDPSSAFATAVESEVLLQGLGPGGPSGLNFGVPAAFFYALGANVDKTTSAAQRFQMATGDAIERLLQQFGIAVDSSVIEDSEPFADTSLGLPPISSFQAARRLAALGVSAASSSPSVTVLAGSPLASLVNDWLSALDPAATAPQNPPLTYPTTDFNLWTQQLAITDPQGYLALDLDAVTQGYVIPPFTASPTVTAGAGSAQLTFATATGKTGPGIGAGMPVAGPNITPGTTVSAVSPTGTVTTVTLSSPVQGTGVPAGTPLVFNYAIPPVLAATTADCPAGGTQLTFGGASGTGGISAGMPVFGANIVPGTTVASVTATTVTLNGAGVSGDVPTGAPITFALVPSPPAAPVTAATSADCPSGSTLTFSKTSGISAGMAASGTNIPPDTTVRSVTATTVTLNGAGVSGDVPSGAPITFALVPSPPAAPVTVKTSTDCPSGSTLAFASTTGISAGMLVSSPAIAPGAALSGSAVPGTFLPGTTVVAVTATTVMLSTQVTGDIAAASPVTFTLVPSPPAASVTAATTVDCPSGNTLTFSGTSGISAGMTVSGTNIPPGTTVGSVTATTVQLSGPGVSGDVPGGSAVTFVMTPSTLADQIAAWLPSAASPSAPLPTVAALKQVTATQWTNFFTVTGGPQWLPQFTAPVAPVSPAGPAAPKAGYVAVRVRAFIRAVQQFFTVSSVATSAQLPAAGTPPTFELPAPDLISEAADELAAASGVSSGFTFGGALSGTELATAVQNVSSDIGPAAQAWLVQAMTTVNDLAEVASPSVVPDPRLRFSVMEALYARGFRSAADITSLSGADFQQALTGTVAYDLAAALYGPETSPTGPVGEPFHPVNPDGSLVNCVPPPWLSPTGPIAYLQELLQLSTASTCDNPFAEPGSGQTTLGTAVTARRGPLGALLASSANLETPLPLIDIVNECLEYLGATQPPPAGSGQSVPTGTIYDTAADQLAGHVLGQEQDGPDGEDSGGHDPAVIFAAMPEHSTPAPFRGQNQPAGPRAYDNLKADFSSCRLPYSQALDVSRSYLRQIGSSRFEELRAFRKCITEFALDPANPPAGFQSYLLRSPVPIDTAIEYLGITPEEYTLLFQGTPSQPCASSPVVYDERPAATVPVAELYGYPASAADQSWPDEVAVLSEFLSRTCLTYCEFLELSATVFAQLNRDSDGDKGHNVYPECEPCCLEDYRIQLPEGDAREQVLLQLAVFIRLWRKLRDVPGAGYTFQQLYDICTVLNLFTGTKPDPEFIRKLAAFQMLRDDFGLPLTDQSDQATGTTGAERTHLLALWAGPGSKKWKWAVSRLLDGVAACARRRYGSEHPPREDDARMADHLDGLSRLAGFNPPTAAQPSADTWHSTPGCTLRFAEVLAKISASSFRIDELLYLFNAEHPRECEHLFPLQDPDDAVNYPLELPEDAGPFSLWKLREALLAVEADEDEACELTWPEVVTEFRDKFGYAPPDGQDPLLSFGQHFFPRVLEAAGFPVSGGQRQYRTALTSATAWNSPHRSPFRYDAGPGELWTQLPLRDEEVAAQLSQLPQLDQAEQAAVQDLYFAPRADLAFAAFLFPDWQSAEIHLIQEHDEDERWSWFRRHVGLASARRAVIAGHLARHVAHRTGGRHEDLDQVAGLLLGRLFSDENTGTPWESDSGVAPAVMWTPPAGSAIAALLGLAGTGLLGEYEMAGTSRPDTATQDTATQDTATQDTDQAPGGAAASAQVAWREVRGPLEAFGHERDLTNSPVPTIVPPLGFTAAASPLATVNNGYAVRTSDGLCLGGAAPVRVRWSGVLLIEGEGDYAFHAGAPAPDGEKPDAHRAREASWRLTLQRGQRTWVVLNHRWPGETEHGRDTTRLRRGAYQIVIEFSQPGPDLTAGEAHPRHTGFQLKYAGPDTADCLVTLPARNLYRDFQDQTLDQGISFPEGSKAQAFLKAFYTSTLRDARRTYLRLFKAVVLAGHLGLSARGGEDHQSELCYLLANPANFAGHAYYRTSPSTFAPHLAGLDFNFLPVLDNYHAPAPVPGDRSDPSRQRTQAMFDWFERLFDYGQVRREVERRREGQLWHLFRDAQLNQPADAAPLLRHIGAGPGYRAIDLRFYQDQSTPVYTVSSTDLEDDRWLSRVWHADQWFRGMLDRFDPKDMSAARPDLWAAQDPGAAVPASGVTETGNANLCAFVADGCCENGEPRRYPDLRRLNDGLRERGREALIAYLCRLNRVPLTWQPAGTFATAPGDLSDLLLLDVEAGGGERASRIEEAITAVQSFVCRSRLGLERGWTAPREFARLWDSRFETYRTWERGKLRDLYQENWIEWTELDKARRTEAFRFLESQLRTSTLTLAAPGGADWWAGDEASPGDAPGLLQRHVPSELRPLSPPPQPLATPPPSTPPPAASATREGLTTLGRPQYPDQPAWLAAVPQVAASATATSAAPADTAPGPETGSSPGAGPADTARAITQAAAADGTQPQPLPLWMESAMKLGTHFVRVAAAGVPEAALGFVPHGEESRTACCHECGRDHPVLIDEYYFWLVSTQFYAYTDQTDTQSSGDASFTGSYQFGFQDSYYDPVQQQSAEWNDEDQVPSLLAKWQPAPAVRLAWCRVHNGEFGQPRRSEEYVALASPGDLVFLGRAGDSLYFEVSGADLPPEGYNDPSPSGFRYDLPPDHAVALPQVLAPPPPATTSPYPGGLAAYPFFAYHQPGARLFPGSWFSTALAVGDALRANCSFELALRWYKRPFDPLRQDCAWVHCPGTDTAVPPTNNEIESQAYLLWVQHGRPADEQLQDWLDAEAALRRARGAAETPESMAVTARPGACCDSTNISEDAARNRAVTLRYCQTLVDWGDALMRRRRSPEAFQQARLLYDLAAKILGRRPNTLLLPEPATTQPVSAFVPAYAPLNPQLLDLYDRTADRLGLIRGYLDARRIRNGQPGRDLSYFGDNPMRQGWRTVPGPCAEDEEWCRRPSPYRFLSQIQKASEIAGRVREFGSALLSAYEKGDAEYLASIHAQQDREMLALGLSIGQDKWRDADWQVQALQQTKDLNQTNLLYYANLLQNGLINDEIQNLNLSTNAIQTRTNTIAMEVIGEIMNIVPDVFVGALSSFAQFPIGTKLASLFETIARVMQTTAEIQSATAALDMTEASWTRRAAEWLHQMQTLPIEIEQTELQILGAQQRRDQALQELNNQQRQIEHATEIQDFLRDKFTAAELYLWLQKETAALHYRMYELALHAAREAQRAFNFERGHTTRHFLPEETWDNLHQGLLAGERLEFALAHMEKAYLDENRRELELAEDFSLRLQFPAAYLRLRTTGYCEIDIPEWMFDLHYPGHYMRRIKNVALTLPCVTGPYNPPHCRLTLLSSMTRIDPEIRPPAQHCCPDGRDRSEYEPCPDDPRIVREYAARDSIATRSSQNDSGMFELNFRDERYLPFEYLGAVSRWRIELPPENNYFDLDTLSDLILHLDYTARDGGDILRAAAARDARGRLPGDGLRLFDVYQDFPDAWPALRGPGSEENHREERDHRGEHDNGYHRLRLGFTPEMFPFVPGRRVRWIDRLLLVFEAPGAAGDHHLVRFRPDEAGHGDGTEFTCVADGARPGFFLGAVDLRQRRLGPLRDDRPTGYTFEIPAPAGEIRSAFVIAHYDAESSPRYGPPSRSGWGEEPGLRRHGRG